MTANPLQQYPSSGPPGNASQSGSARFTPLDPLRVLRQYALVLVASLILGVVIGLAVYFPLLKYRPEFTTEGLMSVTAALTNAYQNGSSNNAANQQREILLTTLNNHIIRLRSDDTLGDAIKRDDVRNTRWYASFNGDARAALTDLSRNLTAAPITGSSVIRTSFKGRYQEDLPKIVNAVMEVYLQKVALDWENQNSGLRRTFVQEVERADQETQQIQEQLRQFTRENDLPTLDLRSHDADIEYQTLAQREADLKTRIGSIKEGYETLLAAQREGRLSPSAQEMSEVEADSAVQTRTERIRQLREQREVMLNRFGANHRSVQETEQQIMATELERKKLIDKLLSDRQEVKLQVAKNSVDSLESEIASLRPQIAKANDRLRELNLRMLQYKQIASNAEDARQRRDKAQDQLNSIRILSQRPDNVTVQLQLKATEATLSFPKMSGVVPGVAMMMLMLTTGLVFLKELLDQRIKSPADVKMLPGTDLLGVLPDADEDPSGATHIENVVITDPSGLMAESFRQVRTATLGKMDRRGFKTLLVTGSQAESGVSSVVNNLAMSMALNGRRVLVVDANWRRPMQYKLFDTPAQPGLIEVLSGHADLKQAIIHKENPDLDVMPAGNMNSANAELLEGAMFGRILSQLEGTYDLILIDGPPVLLASDSQLLANHADAILMVVRAMSEQRGMVARVARQLQGQRAELLGMVLNGVRSSAGGYFRKNYQDFYRYNQASIDLAARRKATGSKG